MDNFEGTSQPAFAGGLPLEFYKQFGPPSDPWDPYYTSPDSGRVSVDPAASIENRNELEVLPREIGGEVESIQTDALEAEGRKSVLGRIVEGIRRNKVIVGAGALMVGSLIASPIGDTLKSLGEAVPEVAIGLAVAEAVWIGGAVIALMAPGKDGYREPFPKTLNPFKLYGAIKTRFNEIGEGANESPWFKVGFAINGVAMIAQFVIPVAGIVANFAPKAWGLLAWPVLELAAAVALRREILKRVHASEPDQNQPV